LALPVHRRLDGQKKLGHTLHLVQRDGTLQAIDEPGRVRFGGIEHHRIVQSQVLPWRASGCGLHLCQRTFATLAGTIDHDHRRIGERIGQ